LDSVGYSKGWLIEAGFRDDIHISFEEFSAVLFIGWDGCKGDIIEVSWEGLVAEPLHDEGETGFYCLDFYDGGGEFCEAV
jgi:hypothetical protein